MPSPSSHSRLPYVYAGLGLAAMFGVVATVLILLACSHWQSSRRQSDLEGEEEGGTKFGENEEHVVLEETTLVIMAGETQPTFLATRT
ncbi:glutamine dumper 5 [Euphorbia peplus]|nr:glutamine dumper 5 [Euphorbia peplus]